MIPGGFFSNAGALFVYLADALLLLFGIISLIVGGREISEKKKM
jgi:hypothetical protein